MSWQPRKLADCTKLLSGGTPKKSRTEYWGGDIPWVSSGEMTESFINDTSLHVTEDGAKNGTRRVPAGTILVVVRGMSLAKEFRISLTMRDMTFNQDLKALSCADDVHSKFLFYALKAKKEAIRETATDASHGTKKLDTDALASVEFPFPETLEEQVRVAEIASAYDGLIENNRRRIELLEQSARLLYREWFVHLRFPGHETAQSVDGLPEGWKQLPMGALCSLRGGNTFKPKYQGRIKGEVPFIKVGDMNSPGNGLFVLEANNWVEQDRIKEIKGKPFSRGDCVFAKIGEALKQNRVRLLARDTLIDNNMMGAIPNTENVSSEFLYFMLSSYDLASHASGAAVPFLSAKVLADQIFIVPPRTLIEEFDIKATPLLAQIQKLTAKSVALSKARDLLLPRLMDGRLSVQE